MANVLLKLLVEDNIDLYYPRTPKTLTIVTQWQLVFIEEVYLQIIKQTINNVKGDDKVLLYLKLLSIIATYIPTGNNLFYPILNYLNQKIQTDQNKEIVRYCKFSFCRIVRGNLK